jgi:WD40 repeat protein
VVLAVVAAVLAQLGAVAVNALTSAPGRWPGGLDLIRRYPFWSAIALTAAVVVVGAVSALRQQSTGGDPGAPALPPIPGWVVGRPAELDRIVLALRRGGDDPVAITTALRGAGGFGKTVLAALVCADRRVRRRFRGRIYLVTMGRDVRGRAAIAAKVAEATRFITGDRETFGDPRLAGAHLGRLLDQRGRCLLVVDDVWEEEQVAPFLVGGRRCARLVTTRIPSAVPGGAAVVVDQMTAEQAERVLTWELPSLPAELVELLLALTGRWPLLLRLANRAMAVEVATGRSAEDAAVDLAEALRAGGPAAVDDLAGRVGAFDMDVPEERARAVRATIEASAGLLPADGMARLTELGVFAEDETVPVELVARLWHATAGLDAAAARALCRRLAGLALMNLSGEDGGLVSLHDVVRAYLRAPLDADRLAGLNAALLDARAADGTAWWDLGEADRYLRDHTVSHMVQAGRVEAAERVATDLRWIVARLRDFGPVAPVADLAAVPTGRARYLHAQLTQMSHLLAPTDPEHALTGILLSRARDVPDWREQADALLATAPGPLLASAWPAPDAPDSAQIRTLSGHTGFLWTTVAAPDGSWLASGGEDKVVRTWDVATGRPAAVYIGHSGFVRALAIAPDGTWFASGSQDNTIRIWDVATRRVRAVLRGHKDSVWALAIAPDGTWLVSSGDDGAVRRWDVATGRMTGVLTSHGGQARPMAMAPDGAWVASASGETVRVTQVASGETAEFTTGESIYALAAAPDGSWLAVARVGAPVRLWDMARGEPLRDLAGTAGGALAIPANGEWLASAGDDGVTIWSLATGALTATFTGHVGEVHGLAAAPDGAWVASAGTDSTIRVWDANRGEPARPAVAQAEVRSVAAPADGAWFVTAARGGAVAVWTPARAEPRLSLDDSAGVARVVAAPDGSWFATADDSGSVRLCDPGTGAGRTVFAWPPIGFVDLAVAADGSRLAFLRTYAANVLELATGKVDEVRRRRDLPWPLDLLQEWYELAALAPDGSWLAISGNNGQGLPEFRRRGKIRLRDLATGRRIRTVTAHRGGVEALLVAPDGSWLASTGHDSTVRVWDLARRRTLRVLRGHTGAVTALAIARDGGLLASVDEYGQVRVWDGAGRTVTMTRVDGRLNACAWVDGGAALAVGGVHGLYLFRFRRH